MPVLPLEPYVHPDDLLSRPLVTESGEDRWWVLHTRPRTEKTLARQFLRRSIPFFLPLYQRQWRSRGRLLSSYNPLFPGYVFLYGDSQARLTALETNLVALVLPVEDQGQLHGDLRRVYQLMSTGAPLTPEERLEPGTLVEITSGPLTGLEGRFIRRGKELKVLVEVQFLQRGVSVEIESWMIQPLAGPSPSMAGSHPR
jgi:transcriptional antiterminator RfaH